MSVFASFRPGLPSAPVGRAGRRCHSTVALHLREGEPFVESCVAGHLRDSGLVSLMAAIGHALTTGPGGEDGACGPAEIPRLRGCPEGRFGQGGWPEEAIVVFKQPGGDQPVSGRLLRRVAEGRRGRGPLANR